MQSVSTSGHSFPITPNFSSISEKQGLSHSYLCVSSDLFEVAAILNQVDSKYKSVVDANSVIDYLKLNPSNGSCDILPMTDNYPCPLPPTHTETKILLVFLHL